MSLVRDAFFARLKSKLYAKLRAHPVIKDIGSSSDLYVLSERLVELNRKRINSYLESQNFSVKEFERAIEAVMEHILNPAIEELRI